MSHAEAFGHFRSFAVGLEKNARALRTALEDDSSTSRNLNALETASAEVTTKELIAEVATEEARLHGVEAAIQARLPIRLVMEKYRALAEYNQLAFKDLEERLSAYGYVPPTRAAAQRSRSSRSDATTGGAKGKNSDGNPAAPHDAEGRGQDERNDEGMSVEEEALSRVGDGVESADIAQLGGVEADEEPPTVPDITGIEGVEDGEAVLSDVAGHSDANDNACEESTVCTPRRSAADEPAGEVESPKTPTLAEWEISQETREMLRQGQKYEKSVIFPPVSTAKSLETLLTEGNVQSGGDVISDCLSPAGRGSGSGGGGDRDTANCSTLTQGGAFGGEGGSLAWESDAPTPELPQMEGNVPWTPRCSAFSPGEEAGVDVGDERRRSRDRDSVETPKPLFRSPPKTPMHRSFFEACMSIGHEEGDTGTETGSSLPSEVPTLSENIEAIASNNDRKLLPGTPGPLDVSSEWPTSGASTAWRRENSVALNEKLDGIERKVDLVCEASEESLGRESIPQSPVTLQPKTRIVAAVEPFSGGQQRSSPDSPRTPTMMTPRRYDSPVSGRTRSTTFARSARSARSSGATPGRNSRNLATPGATPGDKNIASNDNDSSVYDGRAGLSNTYDYKNTGRSFADDDDDDCKTPEMTSPPRTETLLMTAEGLEKATENGAAANVSGRSSSTSSSGAHCRRRLEEAGLWQEQERRVGGGSGGVEDGPLQLVSEIEYSNAPRFLTVQVSRNILNEAIRNLNAYAAPRVDSPSALLLTAEEITAIIDQGELSRTLLLCVAHLKRIEMQMKGTRMYRIRSSPI